VKLTGQQREKQDNRLKDEHLIRTPHGSKDLLCIPAFLPGLDFIGAPDVLAGLAQLLGLAVQQHRRSRFARQPEVQELRRAGEYELDVKVPAPGEELLNGAAADAADDCSETVGRTC
jgi:hypothetical protein